MLIYQRKKISYSNSKGKLYENILTSYDKEISIRGCKVLRIFELNNLKP